MTSTSQIPRPSFAAPLLLILFLLALPASAGLRFTPVPGPEGADTFALAADGTTLWAGTLRGVWKLQSGSWSLDGLPDKTVSSVATFGGSVYAATGDALYLRGTDGTWTAVDLPGSPDVVSTVLADGIVLYAGGSGLFRNAGGTWTSLPLAGGVVSGLVVYQGDLVAGLTGAGIVRYPGGTGAPVPMSTGLGFSEGGQAFAVFGGLLYTGTPRGVYGWSGLAWNFETSYGLHDVRALASASGSLWAASFDAGVFRKSGTTWSAANDGLLFYSAKSFAVLGSDLYVGTAGAPVYRYSGAAWSAVGSGLTASIVSDIGGTTSSGGFVPLATVATRGAGVAIVSLSGSSSLMVPVGCGDIQAISGAGSGELASVLAATNCGPYLLNPVGLPPGLVNQGLPAGAVLSSMTGALSGGDTLAGTTNAGIWQYSNFLETWSAENDGLAPTASIATVQRVGDNLFAGPDQGIVRLGTDGAWHDESSGLPFGSLVQAVDGARGTPSAPAPPSGPVYAGLLFGGIYRRDAGTTFWRSDSKGIGNGSVYSIDMASGRLFAATGTAALFRKEAGTWLPESFGLPAGAQVRVVRQIWSGGEFFVYAGTAGNGLYVANAFPSVKTIPVVLDVPGTGGASFRTELLIGNSSASFYGPSSVRLTFTAAPGYGAPAGGSATVTIPAGTEIRAADALAYLRGLGIPIPAAAPNAPIAGSLTLSIDGPGFTPLPDGIYGAARSYTNGPSGGTYGVFLEATSDIDAAEESAWVYGLRSVPGTSRSNLAVTALPGRGADSVTLEVQIYSASGAPAPTLLTRTLAPGEWHQWNGVLAQAGLPDGTFGYARVRRLSGSAAWIAYGVVNDAVTSDGSVLPMFRPGGVSAARTLIVPVAVDLFGQGSSHFTTELTLVNDGPIGTPVDLTYHPAPGYGSAGGVPVVSVTVAAKQQTTIPDILQYLRDHGVTIPDASTGQQAGTLLVSFRNLTSLTTPRTVALARTSTPGASGGSYGVFYPAFPSGGGARTPAVVTGLVQNGAARSNLAIVHAGGGSGGPITLQVTFIDVASGLAVGALTQTLNAGEWYQWSNVLQKAGILPGTTSAYAVITRTSGDDTFFGYGVLNDAVTSDGSYVGMRPDAWY